MYLASEVVAGGFGELRVDPGFAAGGCVAVASERGGVEVDGLHDPCEPGGVVRIDDADGAPRSPVRFDPGLERL